MSTTMTTPFCPFEFCQYHYSSMILIGDGNDDQKTILRSNEDGVGEDDTGDDRTYVPLTRSRNARATSPSGSPNHSLY